MKIFTVLAEILAQIQINSLLCNQYAINSDYASNVQILSFRAKLAGDQHVTIVCKQFAA